VIVEPDELVAVVTRLTGTAPRGWKSEVLYEPIASATAGIRRVWGDAWSVVVKVVHDSDRGHPQWLSGSEMGHWAYWRREVHAYEDGLTDSLGGRLRGPRCLGIFERADGAVALWLEDAAEDGVAGTSWGLERYEEAAEHLGQAQGTFIGRVPDRPWLAKGWLRSYLGERSGDVALLGQAEPWREPLVQAHLGRHRAEPLRRMWADQGAFLETLDGLPQTVCHNDLHPANLFAVGRETVLIDWAFVGVGAIGEDAAVLVADSVLDFHVEPERFEELFEKVWRAYAAGMADAGWPDAEEVVRKAMDATLGARYGWIGPAMLRAVTAGRTTMNRRPIAEAVAWWGQTVPLLLDHAGAARERRG